MIDLDPRTRIASLFLLPDCDMACRFCASERLFSVMSFERAAALLRELRARGVESVVFGGGEPFLWPHGLERLCQLGRRLGFLVQVCTNGVALPPGYERSASVDRYILPIESMDPAVHDALRRRRGGGHLRLVLERIDALRGCGRELTVSTVVTRDNAASLPAIADYLQLVRARGVALHAWHLYRFLPVGRGGTPNSAKLAPAPGEFGRACAAVRRRELGFPVYRRPDMLRSSTVEFFWVEGGRLLRGGAALSRAAAARAGAG